MSEAVIQTLEARGKRYGSFMGHSQVTQALKIVMQEHPKWAQLQPYHKEALDMIVHKIGRVLNGDPDYIDNWHDIAGYAVLVEQILKESKV
jgi:GTP1/Obg family GTP-binding protein